MKTKSEVNKDLPFLLSSDLLGNPYARQDAAAYLHILRNDKREASDGPASLQIEKQKENTNSVAATKKMDDRQKTVTDWLYDFVSDLHKVGKGLGDMLEHMAKQAY